MSNSSTDAAPSESDQPGTSRDLRQNIAFQDPKRLNRLLAASNDAFWEWNVETGEFLVSPRWCEIARVPPGEVPTNTDDAARLIHPEDLPRVQAAVHSLLAGNRCDLEHRYCRGDAGDAWVHVRVMVTERCADGRPLWVSGVITDITPRKRAEENLRHFELAARDSRDIILFMRRDNGRILGANDAAVKAYGYSHEELLSLSIYDLREPRTRALIGDQMAEADADAILFETIHRRRDGSTFPVEVSSRGATVGDTRTLISVVRDITRRKRAEDALRESEALLRAICETTADCVFLKDRDGRMVLANPTTLRTIGRPAGEVIGRRDDEFYEDRALAVAAMETDRRVMESGETQVLEETLPTTLGDRVFLCTKTPWRDAYGRVIGMVGVARDITDRKRRERELAEAKSRQEILADVVSRLLASEEPQSIVNDLARRVMEKLECDLFFNYLVDTRQGRLHLNACAGVSEDGVRELEWLDYGAAVCGCVARDGRRIVAERIHETDDPRTDVLKSYGTLAYACHPLLAGGKVIGTLAFGSRTRSSFSEDDLALMQAVTQHIAIALERVRAERVLRESEERYRAIARGIPDAAVWVVDSDLRFVVADGTLAIRLGMVREQFEGRTAGEALAGPLCRIVEPRLRCALGGKSVSYEMKYGGRDIWTQYVPLRDGEGAVVAAMALSLDITERKRVEEQLQHAQKMESIGVLAGGVAHDFNNLLTSILGNASLAQLEAQPGIQERLDSIVEATERAAALTRQLLAYAGKGHFEITDFDLADLITSSAGLIRVSIPRNVRLIVDVPSGLPAIRGDGAQIQQVIMNLVINAAEAIGTQQGGTVSIHAIEFDRASDAPPVAGFGMPPGHYVCLMVRDTGCGMDEATSARIFDPFFTTKFTGRGLGLAAVQGILRSHNGGIAVRSAPGQGSTFMVYLPSLSPAAVRTSGTEPAIAAQRALTVLVVDDEPAVRSFAQAAFKRLGHRVLLAGNGREALEVLSFNRYIDLVILDVVMPVVGGGETLAEIRRRWPGIAVLMTSGYNREEALRLGTLPDDLPFIEKPYTVQKLAAAVCKALDGRDRTST